MYATCLFKESEDCITWDDLPINEVFILAQIFWMKISENHVVQVKKNQDGDLVACGFPEQHDPSWNLKLIKIQG